MTTIGNGVPGDHVLRAGGGDRGDGGGRDADAALRAGGAEERFADADRLRAGGPQRRGEGVDALVGGGERVGRGQAGLEVGTAEGDGAGVVRHRRCRGCRTPTR